MAQIEKTITSYLTALKIEGKTQTTIASYANSLADFRRVERRRLLPPSVIHREDMDGSRSPRKDRSPVNGDFLCETGVSGGGPMRTDHPTRNMILTIPPSSSEARYRNHTHSRCRQTL